MLHVDAPPPVAAPAADLLGATRATYVAFGASGFAFASWASRIPQVRDRLHLSPSDLGLVLLAIALGSVLSLPLSGAVIARAGSGRTVRGTSLLLSVAFLVVAAGQLVGVVPVVVGLFLMGLAYGTWDVAMNVQGADVERRLRRSVMSRFHAGFSLGTVAGALLGAAAVAAHLPVAAHLAAVAVLVALVVPWQAGSFLPDVHEPAETPDGARPYGALTAWREPRTLLVGLCVLAFAFAEGVGNDWISVAALDGYGVSSALATLAFATFLVAMTVGRWLGPELLDRHGRVPVVRLLSGLALCGLLLFVFAPVTPLAYLGALLWGAGTSLGFPVGMSAAADDPRRAAARVSVVSSIGYCAFLAGPPLIGVLGDRFGVLRALVAVAVLLAVGVATSSALRPLEHPAS